MLGYMSYKGILNVAFNNFSANDRVGPLYWFGKLRKKPQFTDKLHHL